MRTILAFALALGLGGCIEEGGHATALCARLCDCTAPAPSAHDRCMASCTAQVPDSLPAACESCILSASCTEIVADRCDAVCSVEEPPVLDASDPRPRTTSALPPLFASALETP